MKVYLDDERKEPEGWTRTRTAAETIELLKTGRVTHLSLDHDLAFEHYAGQYDSRTGYAVVLWLEQQVVEDESFVLPEVTLHTMNPVGHAHMKAGLQKIKQLIKERQHGNT